MVTLVARPRPPVGLATDPQFHPQWITRSASVQPAYLPVAVSDVTIPKVMQGL